MHNPDTPDNPYLSPSDWIDTLPLLKDHPAFQDIGLIVEGCIGDDEFMAYWLVQAFPNAIYVGADMAPGVTSLNTDRVDEGITAAQYQKLLEGQAQLNDEDGNAGLVTFRTNCLAPAFIASLREHSQATRVMFATYNGLVALLGLDSNPGARKTGADLTPDVEVAQTDLFDVQLHITQGLHLPRLWSAPPNVVTRWYYQLEQTAKAVGKVTLRIKDGLVLHE